MLRSSLELQLPSWPLLEPFTLEFNYSSIINDIFETYNEDYLQLVNKYRKKTDRKVFPISREFIDSNPDLINNNISLLKNAIELGRTAIEVSDSISPILLHYSWHCLMSFFNYSLFYWDPKHARGHGLRTKLNNDPNKITLTIQQDGIFKRCIDVFTLLGYPTVFSKYIPKVENNKVEFIENQEFMQRNKEKIQLNDILNFNYSDWMKKLNFNEEEIIESYLMRSGNSRCLNNSLVSYSIIFIVSNIARYRPALWNQILLGKDEFNAKIIRNYRTAIRYYAKAYGAAGFIMIVQDILKGLKNNLKFYIRINGLKSTNPIKFI